MACSRPDDRRPFFFYINSAERICLKVSSSAQNLVHFHGNCTKLSSLFDSIQEIRKVIQEFALDLREH